MIDEIQNAVRTAAKTHQTKPLIKFLVELTNETATSLLFCGTLDAEELFVQKEHLKRRTRGLRLLPLKYDVSYRKFITELWNYQVTLEESELTEKLMKQIYDLTAGIPAYIVKVVQEAQIQAILTGAEKVTYDLMKKAIAILGIDVPKYYGGNGTSISDFNVKEVEMEGSEESGRRYFATKRGRPESGRDETDILELSKSGTDFLKRLEKLNLIERRCI